MITKKDKNKLQPIAENYCLKPEIKEIIRKDKALMRALEDRWDISPITLYQWVQKSTGKILHPESLSLLELYLKKERYEIIKIKTT